MKRANLRYEQCFGVSRFETRYPNYPRTVTVKTNRQLQKRHSCSYKHATNFMINDSLSVDIFQTELNQTLEMQLVSDTWKSRVEIKLCRILVEKFNKLNHGAYRMRVELCLENKDLVNGTKYKILSRCNQYWQNHYPFEWMLTIQFIGIFAGTGTGGTKFHAYVSIALKD